MKDIKRHQSAITQILAASWQFPIFTLLALAALGHCKASLGSCEPKFELVGDPRIATCAELDVLHR